MFGIKCTVCDSMVYCDEAQIGEQVPCPICFTKLLVEPPPEPVHKYNPWQPTIIPRNIVAADEDVELTLGPEVERPKETFFIDPSHGLDPVEDDLLSPLSRPNGDHELAVTSESQTSERQRDRDSENVVRGGNWLDRANQERSSQPKLREQPGTFRRKQSDESRDELGATTPDETRISAIRRKQERHRQFQSRMDLLAAMFSSPGIRWRTGLAGVLIGVGWGMMHFFNNNYNTMKAQSTPTIGEWAINALVWFVFGVVPYAVGTLLAWYVSGYAFRTAASRESIVRSWMPTSLEEVRSTFLLFAFSFFVVGLPITFVPWLVNPFRFLCAPPLLLAAWTNQSPFAIVSRKGFTNFHADSWGWRFLYEFILILAGLALVAGLLMTVYWTGVLFATSLIGGMMMAMVTISFATVIGNHCSHVTSDH